MPVPKKRFLPRKLKAGEMPGKKRASSMKRALALLPQHADRLAEVRKALEAKAAQHNQQVDNWYEKSVKDAARAAMRAGKQLTAIRLRELEEEKKLKYVYAYREAHYLVLQEIIDGLQLCQPDIDNLSQFSLRPDSCIVLHGTCFGPSHGKVLLEVSSQHVIELDVRSWSDTKVEAVVNSIIGEVPLRPYYGKIWLQTGNGVRSNVWPIQYYPVYSWYLAFWNRHIFGGIWGCSKDETFLRNRKLGDSDFWVERVERSHSSDGWSELRYPFAGGQDLAQGYHIAVDAARHARMHLTYVVCGPKNINPPYVDELGPWAWLCDIW